MLITKVLEPRKFNSTEIGILMFIRARYERYENRQWEDLDEHDKRVYIHRAQALLDSLVSQGTLGIDS